MSPSSGPWRRLAAILIVVAPALPPPVAAADTILFATEGDYPPWNEVAADGRLIGFDIELIDALCGEIGESCQATTASFPAMIDRLAAGDFDAVISGIAITPERESIIQFTRPYMSLSVSFAAAAGSPLAEPTAATTAATLDRLAEARIGAQAGTVNADLVRELLPEATLTLVDDQAALNRAVGDGSVEAGVAATLAWTDAAGPEGAIVTLGPPFASASYPVLGEGLAIGIARGNDALKAALDAAICRLTAAGAVAALSLKWFGADLSVPCDIDR